MASKAYVASMTVAELVAELKQRGLSVKGRKRELRERLEQAFDDEELNDPSSDSDSEQSKLQQPKVETDNWQAGVTASHEPMIVAIELSNKSDLEVSSTPQPEPSPKDNGCERKESMIIAIELEQLQGGQSAEEPQTMALALDAKNTEQQTKQSEGYSLVVEEQSSQDPSTAEKPDENSMEVNNEPQSKSPVHPAVDKSTPSPPPAALSDKTASVESPEQDKDSSCVVKDEQGDVAQASVKEPEPPTPLPVDPTPLEQVDQPSPTEPDSVEQTTAMEPSQPDKSPQELKQALMEPEVAPVDTVVPVEPPEVAPADPEPAGVGLESKPEEPSAPVAGSPSPVLSGDVPQPMEVTDTATAPPTEGAAMETSAESSKTEEKKAVSTVDHTLEEERTGRSAQSASAEQPQAATAEVSGDGGGPCNDGKSSNSSTDAISEKAEGATTECTVEGVKPTSMQQATAVGSEVSMIPVDTGTIDDVVVHAEEDEFSVFSTEASEANRERSSPSSRDKHKPVSLGIDDGASLPKQGVDSSRNSVPASQEEKQASQESVGWKRNGSEHSEQSSAKKRRISAGTGGKGGGSVASPSTPGDRKRRWGSASSKHKPSTTTTTNISSDVLEDIITSAGVEEAAFGSDSAPSSALEAVMEYGEGGGGGGGGGGEEEVESKAAGLLGESPMVEPEDGGSKELELDEHEIEWQEREKRRQLQRRESERARQEVETRRRIEARLRAKKEEEKKEMAEKTSQKKRSPSPARNKPSRLVHVSQLTRPFTIIQLKELLAEDGPMIDGGFWTNKIKSQCIAIYRSEEVAVASRNRLHGIKWPSTNPKLLVTDFLTTSEAFNISEGQLVVEEKEDEASEGSKDQGEEAQQREPRKPLVEKTPANEEATKKESLPEGEGKHEKEVSSPQSSKEDKATTLLDDLFRKTKATPCIYWLPLTDAQVKEKEEEQKERDLQRQRRMKEREDERKEQREREEKERRERERRVKEERERRARERQQRHRSYSRSRSRSRSKDRDRGRRRR